MNLRKWGLAALGFVVAAGGATGANATQPIERSGNTYHMAVCARGQALSEARCHARAAARSYRARRGAPH